jgi:hypothetical protein
MEVDAAAGQSLSVVKIRSLVGQFEYHLLFSLKAESDIDGLDIARGRQSSGKFSLYAQPLVMFKLEKYLHRRKPSREFVAPPTSSPIVIFL